MDACQEYEGLISAFIDGEITETERAKLMEHMAACPACQRYFDDQIAIHDALTGLEARAPADFSEKVMARVRATPQERPHEETKRIAFPSWRRWAALAACCALAAGVWAFGPGQARDTAQDSVVQYARDAVTEDSPVSESAAQAEEPAEDIEEAARDNAAASGGSGAGSSLLPVTSDEADGGEAPQEMETGAALAPPPAPAEMAPSEDVAGKVQIQDAEANGGGDAPPVDSGAANAILGEAADEAGGEMDAGLQLFQASPEDSAAGVYGLTETETVAVTITAWQDEGFTAQVMDPGDCDFLRAGDEVLVWFEAGTEVHLAGGTVFTYDGDVPNATDCGLAAGTAVTVAFSAYETDPALRLYAIAIQE